MATPETATLQGNLEKAQLTEDDFSAFVERLTEFGETLPEREQAILGEMILEMTGDERPEDAKDEAIPSSDEIAAFMEKLNRFHDELPGDQHLYLDHLIVGTALKEQVDVQGYAWPMNRWIEIPNKQRGVFMYMCFRDGGEIFKQRWIPGAGHRKVMCVDLY